MVEWVIWYDDGSSHSSLDGPPEKAARRGVEAIAMVDPDTGRSIDWGRDWYWRNGTDWLSGDQYGVLDFLMLKGVARYNASRSLWERIDGNKWVASDLYAMLFAFLEPTRTDVVILAGRCMTNPKFRALYQVVIDDPRLPPKSARMAQEQLPPGETEPLPPLP